MKYTETKLKQSILDALVALDFKEMTLIQELGIPELLKKRNVMMKAPTGTGKTHAFLLPILENIDPENKHVQAIIMAPTRELATQISLVARMCIKHMKADISVGLLIGGKDRGRLIEAMTQSQPHIIIGTPGRLEDMIVKEKKVDMRYIDYVVLDETDMIVENGFLESIDAIFTMLPETVTYAVCSATISQEIQQFIKKYVKNVAFIDAKKSKLANDKIEHLLLSVRENKRLEKLYEITEILDPYMALIFANTKKKVIEIYEFLQSKGMKVGMLHGDMKARERKQMLKRMQLLEFQY
ncbi:MAG: DEAD/DEAH box helicase, partial [Culicoidibacterales bacterium]